MSEQTGADSGGHGSETMGNAARTPTIRWVGGGNGHLEVIDQRELPGALVILKISTVEEVFSALQQLAIRGAPAIGLAAGYGMFLAARTVPPSSQSAVLIDVLRTNGAYLQKARAMSMNLEWAISQMVRVAISERAIGVRQLQARLLQEANALLEEDTAMCLSIGRHGADFIKPGTGVLTHCNAGGLACSSHGTALSMLYEAQRRGTAFRVFVDETRPLFQGSRLTAWELTAAGIDVTLICDSMAGLVMAQKKVNVVVLGADRIARNGDVANKIGSYSVATLAKAHGIPVIVAAPSSTFDLSLASGAMISIEERPGTDITEVCGKKIAPPGIKTYNPAFDVMPAQLVTAIVTERGVISPVNEATVGAMVNR